MELFSGVGEALRQAQAAGWLLVMVSNQSGVGRGLITKAQVQAVNAALESAAGIHFDGVYCCYADPADPYGAEERKPSPVLAEKAVQDLAIDPSISYFIGDRWSDIECGRRAGFRTFLVETGTSDPETDRKRARETADHTFADLAEAVGHILRETAS